MKVRDLFSGIGRQVFLFSVGCCCLSSGSTQAQDRGIRMVHDSSLHEVAQFLMHELSFKIDLAVRKGELPAWKDAKRTLRYTGAESLVLFYDSAEIDLFAPDGSGKMVKGNRMEWREIERWQSLAIDDKGSLLIQITATRKVWFEPEQVRSQFPEFAVVETVLRSASLPLNYTSFQESFKRKSDSLSNSIITMANVHSLGIYSHPWLDHAMNRPFPGQGYLYFHETKVFRVANTRYPNGEELRDSTVYAPLDQESIDGYYFYNEAKADSQLQITFKSLSVIIPGYRYAPGKDGAWQRVHEYPVLGYDNLHWLDCSELKQKLPPADYQFLESLNRYYLLNARAFYRNEFFEPW